MRIRFYQQGMQRLLKLASCRALTIADVWSQAENRSAWDPGSRRAASFRIPRFRIPRLCAA
jgi:hypothetical protein